MTQKTTRLILILSLWIWLRVSFAVDGVIEINQARALAGGITPGDTPGFPVTLSLPGSYRLTGNLRPGSNNNGIDIASDDVTLDLNGFSIRGPTIIVTPIGQQSAETYGINGSQVRTTVFNGVVAEFTKTSIRLGPYSRVSNLHVSRSSNGIVTDQSSIINGNTVEQNFRFGIIGESGSTVSNNTAASNGSAGIFLRHGTLIGNVSNQNGNNGFQIVSSIVMNNSASFNGGHGFDSAGSSSLIGNVARLNSKFGLKLSDNDGYKDNVLSSNDEGNVDGGVSLGSNICNGVLC